MAKLVWRVDPVPVGLYRSFEKRGWPSASYDVADGNPAVMIQCEDEYRPARAKAGTHKELTVFIADYSVPAASRFSWRKVKERAGTLETAKALAQRIIDQNPGIQPKGD